MTGVERIAQERERQIKELGYSVEKDVDDLLYGDLAMAGACYALPEKYREHNPPKGWPFRWYCWKPTPEDRIHELARAGALIAAEIDRIQAVQKRNARAQRKVPDPAEVREAARKSVADPETMPLRGERVAWTSKDKA